MSDNKLLAENTIRRFMKLANVDTMADNFVAEMYHGGNKPKKKPKELEEYNEEEINEEEEVELEENLEDLEEQEEAEEDEDEVELDAEMGDMDLDMDAEAPAEPGAADISLTEEEARLLIDLGERLSAAMDEDAGAEDIDAPAMDMGDEAPGMDDDEALDDDDPGYGAAMREDTDELVNEVLKRVTKRLVQSKLRK